MLRAGFFAFPAFDAHARFSLISEAEVAVIEIGVPIVEGPFRIVKGEDLRDRDIRGAMVLLNAITAFGAGDRRNAINDVTYLTDCDHLLVS